MSFESPISVLQNLAGEEVAVISGSALGSVQPGVAVLAKDGSGNAQFLNMNASGELLVNAAVDVSLTASSDSVTVHGNRAVLLQDAADDVLLVRDNDAADAIDSASTAISGAVAAMDSNLGGKLVTLDTSIGEVEAAVASASTAISGAIASFQTAFEAENFATEATLDAFKSANHTDLVAASAAITGSIAGMNSDLGGKLDTLDGSVDAVATAVGTAEAGIVSALTGSVAGAISTMDSNLGGKLDTLDGSVDSASTAISGAVAAMDSNLGGKLVTLDTSIGEVEAAVASASTVLSGAIAGFQTAFEAENFATETTLDAFKSANHTDLEAVSGSIVALGADLNAQLEQFTFNASGSLKVEADVNVTLAYGDDSVTVYGSQGQALVQDVLDNKLLVRDTNAKDAIDLVATAVGTAEQGIVAALTGSVSGAISTMDSNLGGKLEALDGSVDAASSAISGSVVALGADLNAFASANHTDLTALNTSVGEVETAVSSASSAISGSIVALGADLSAQLDQFQFNASGSLKVEADVNVQLTYGDDSVTSHQGGTWDVSVNNFPAVQAVSQDAAGAPWSVSATDLDIRDLVHTQDSVKIYGDEGVAFAQISGSGEMITIPLGNEGNSFLQSASGSIWTDADGNGALLVGLLGSNSKNVLASNTSDQLYVEVANPFDGIVTATDLDIRLLTNADVVTVDGFSTFASANHTDIEAVGTAVGAAEAGIVAALTGSVAGAIAAIDAAQLGIVTVDATNLDIRNLDEASDRVNVFGTDLSGSTRALAVDGGGNLITRKKAAEAFVSSKVASTAAETIYANADRMGATFFMDGNATCYIKLGSGASSTDFSVRLVNNGYYELPEGYTGEISVAFSVNDNALKLRITELTYA